MGDLLLSGLRTTLTALGPPYQVWCLFGDGAFGYSLIEFDTFVRHKVTELS